MKIEQFVMAYGVEQDRLRSILPTDFVSLRPVLRINAEITDDKTAYLEFNTAVEKCGNRGWLNIGYWNNIDFKKIGTQTIFKSENLEISFARVGIQGYCPAEKDNTGCYFLADNDLRPPETINSNKEFCDCEFRWCFNGKGAYGKSIGKTLSSVPTEIVNIYPKIEFTVENAATIPCEQVLGTYVVEFEREEK